MDPAQRRLRVLFLCTGNRARSQMAEGFLRHLASDRFDAFSAGTEPKGLSPTTVMVMREAGIDVSGHRSKSLDVFAGQDFDYVITVCDAANAACPVFAHAANRLHWSVTDPAEFEHSGMKIVDAFRAARDQLSSRIKEFLSVHAERL